MELAAPIEPDDNPLFDSLSDSVLQQQLLRMVMDSLPQYLFWKDHNSIFLGCNQKLAQMAGLNSPDEIVGKSDYDLPWTKEESDFFRLCDRRIMDSNIPELGIIEPQLQADGRHAWLETNKLPLHDAEGNVIGILGSCQDVTERHEAEIALKQLNEELERRVEERTVKLQQALTQLEQAQVQMVQAEKMSSMGQLVAGIAHEINNPINFIHGNLSYVQDYAQELMGFVDRHEQSAPILAETKGVDLAFIQTDLPKLLSSMKVGTNRIRDIVLSLRNFSRLDETEFKAVNLHEGIDNTLLILHHRFEATADRPVIQVIKNYGDLPLLQCYAGQLNQVFMNVLTNAIDAIDSLIASHSNTISITTAVENDHVKIVIADTGTGIPEDIRSRLFDPFFTTKAVGKGTGLGLSISYQIVTDRHHGKLYCVSTPGEGAQFCIEIPYLFPGG
jgi:two-component system, NtrC family, sensor kinase